MAPRIQPVDIASDMPKRCDVAIIGAGLVGLSAALTLAERGLKVAVFDKGGIAAEQSSRNLGWVRKTSRTASDIPLAQAADRLWGEMAGRVGADVGYRQRGIMFVARTDAEMAMHERWFGSVRGLDLDSRLLTGAEVDTLVPGGTTAWRGGVYTSSDGTAEPTRAASAVAAAARARGVDIVQNCAVRTLSLAAGRVAGVVTERGEVACQRVILAGGLWSRRFLGNLGVELPILPLICYALRTSPIDGPFDIALGAPEFSFRRHESGGFVMTHRAALGAPFVLDHMRLGLRYVPMLKQTWRMIRPILGRPMMDDLGLARRWTDTDVSPFEKHRMMDPPANDHIGAQALAYLAAAWPAFAKARIVESWAGTMDITPDSQPVMCNLDRIPGLTLATGFSGHGFGTAPAAGQLAADLAMEATPLVDPAPYRIERFWS